MKKQVLATVLALMLLAGAGSAVAQSGVVTAGDLTCTVEDGAVTAVTVVGGEAAALPDGETVVEDVIVHTVLESGGAAVQVQAVTGAEAAGQQEPQVCIQVEENDDGVMPADMAALFAAYEAIGITMDENGVLFYEGKALRTLTDTRSVDAEGQALAVFTYMNEAGGIEAETLRDYARPDENGDGLLLGLKLL